jgi:hypothetical protein
MDYHKAQQILALANAGTLTEDQQVTLVFTVHDALKAVAQHHTDATSASRQTKLQERERLLTWMKANETTCLELRGGTDEAAAAEVTYLRLRQRTTTARALTCDMVCEAVAALSSDTCTSACECAARDAAAALEAWRAARVKELLKAVPIAERRRPKDLAEVRARITREVAAEAPPVQPAAIMRGKGRANPTRPPLVTAVPTMRELLRAVLYRAVHATHKVVKPVLVLDTKPGRDAVTPAAACGAAVEAAVKNFCGATTAYARAAAANAKVTRPLREALARCSDTVQRYIMENHPADRKLRRLKPGSAEEYFTLKVEKARVWEKPLKLWDVSCVVDAAVDAVAASLRDGSLDRPCAPGDVACWMANPAVRDALLRAVQSQLAALERERVVEKPVLRQTASRPRAGAGAGAGGSDDDDDADALQDDDDDDGASDDDDE